MSNFTIRRGNTQIFKCHIRRRGGKFQAKGEVSTVIMDTPIDGFYMTLLDHLLQKPKFRRALREKLPKKIDDF